MSFSDLESPMDSKIEPLVQVQELKQYFALKGGFFRRVVSEVRAVDGVDLAIPLNPNGRIAP